MKKEVYCVVPWLNIDSRIDVGPVAFVPWKTYREKVADKALRSHIDASMSPFKDNNFWDKELHDVNPSIVLVNDVLLLPDNAYSQIHTALRLLLFHVTYTEKMYYINSDAFAIFTFQYEKDVNNIVFGPRRSLSLADANEVLITKPLSACPMLSQFGTMRTDCFFEAYGKLFKARKSTSRLFINALNFYHMSFSDADENEYVKMTYLISAFETLCNTDKSGKVRQLVASHVTSKRRGRYARIDKYKRNRTPKKEFLTLPAYVLLKLYHARNGFMHNHQYRDMHVFIDKVQIPLWTLSVLIFQSLLMHRLKEQKLLLISMVEETFFLKNHFDGNLDDIIEREQSRMRAMGQVC